MSKWLKMTCGRQMERSIGDRGAGYSIKVRNEKKQINIQNLLKVGNKETTVTSLTPFCNLYCQIWSDFTHCCFVSIVCLEQAKISWVNSSVWTERNDSKLANLTIVEYLCNNASISNVPAIIFNEIIMNLSENDRIWDFIK